MSVVLEARDVHVDFPVRDATFSLGRPRSVHAVDGVSCEVRAGEVLALVGESGSGKTTMGKTMVGLLKPAAGSIVYRGRDLKGMRGGELRALRRRMQLIYQDPYESLDSRQTVFETVAEPLLVHHMASNEHEMRERVYAALAAAGLHPPAEVSQRYPHHLSGGERQRVVIAAAMVCEPDLVVADEPVSMLDVSVRAEILRLMLDLRKSRELTYVFITHDLSLAWVIADRIAVMYLGRIVEIGPTEDVIRRPKHPYTKALVTVVPTPVAGSAGRKIILSGETPSPADIPTGCRFHTRCWLWQRLKQPERCTAEDPSLRTVADAHSAACHFFEEVES
jgi:oligopeptide/dipeptide ABC transporter ATP-binding protein